MEEKKNNKGLVWLIVILIILVLGFVGYIIYDKTINDDNELLNNNTTTTTTIQSDLDEKYEEVIKEVKKYEDNLVEYEYSKYYDYYRKFESIKINNKEIELDTFKDNKVHDSLEINVYKNFVVITTQQGAEVYSTYNMYIYNYDGEQIYVTDTVETDLDKLVFAGDYSYDEKEQKLFLTYHLSCNLDNNACHKLYDDKMSTGFSCNTINKYRDSISEATYEIGYLGDNSFSEMELDSKLPLIENDYFKYIFENCK